MLTTFLCMSQNLWSRFRISILVAVFITAGLPLSFSAGAERNQQDEQPPNRNPNLRVDQRVQDLLSRMTLEEKLAQTQAMWITNNLKSFIDEKGNFTPDAKVQEILKNGSGQLGGPSNGSSESE